MRIVDLSAPIAPSPPDPARCERVEVRDTAHAGGASQVQAMLGVPPELLRHGEGLAVPQLFLIRALERVLRRGANRMYGSRYVTGR